MGRRKDGRREERNTLTEGTIMELTRNLALGKFPRIHKDDPNEKSKQ